MRSSCDVLQRLERELRHAPREAILRVITRVEALVIDLRPDEQYPSEWIVFRVTGYREEANAIQAVPGKDLIASLAGFCAALCNFAKLRSDEAFCAGCIAESALRESWRVSPSTMKRLRAHGLVVRRAITPDNRAVIIIAPAIARYFAQRITPRERPARASVETRERIVLRAQQLAHSGKSLNTIARDLAAQESMSIEGVRQVLIRSPATANLFHVEQHLTTRRQDALLRLWRRGVSIPVLAKLAGRGAPGVRRYIALARARALQRILLSGAINCPPGAWESAPNSPANSPTWPEGDIPPGAMTAKDEAAIVAAFHAARSQAALVTRTLDHDHPAAGVIDHIETLLRRATLLKRAIVLAQSRAVRTTLDARRPGLGDDPVFAGIALRAAAGALDHFTPLTGRRFAGAASLAADRAIVPLIKSQPVQLSKKAANLLNRPIDLSRLSAWDRALSPPPRVAAGIGGVSAQHREWLHARYGLAGTPPRTIAELAPHFGLNERTGAQFELRALAACVAHALRSRQQ